jgi:hypothetical protein
VEKTTSTMFDDATFSTMIKPYLSRMKEQIKSELVNESRREISQLFELTSSLETAIERNILKEAKEKSENNQTMRASLDKISLVQQSIRTELADVRQLVTSTAMTASTTRDQVAEISTNSIPALANLGFVKREFANVMPEIEKISKLERRIKSLEQDVIKAGMDSPRVVHSDPTSPRFVDKILREVEKLTGEVSLVQATNLDLANKKVDITVLEELMRHIATREELKKIAKKASAFVIPPPTAVSGDTRLEELLMDRIDQRMSLATSNEAEKEERLFTRIHSRVDSSVVSHITKIQDAISKIQQIISSPAKKTPKPPAFAPQLLIDDDVDNDAVYNTLRRDFDEKLYLVCTDLAECKAAWKLAAHNPLQRSGCWLWNSGRVKLGSTIPWNIESLNTGSLVSLTPRPGKL